MPEIDRENHEILRGLIEAELAPHGASFVHFVDLSSLPKERSRGFPTAILIGISLSKEFVKKVTDSPDYVEDLIRSKDFSSDEYLQKEQQVDRLADQIEDFLSQKGYSAVSQSEARNLRNGLFDEEKKSSILPHKTIANLAGLGWIGKNNLLVTKEFGCAFCMCTVLTDAPLKPISRPPSDSHCHQCEVCKMVCPTDAIFGTIWKKGTPREEIVDVEKCKTCLKCMILCPWTQKYEG